MMLLPILLLWHLLVIIICATTEHSIVTHFTVIGIAFAVEVFLHEKVVRELNAVTLRADTTELCNKEKPTKPLQRFLSSGHCAVNSTAVDQVWYNVVRPIANATSHFCKYRGRTRGYGRLSLR